MKIKAATTLFKCSKCNHNKVASSPTPRGSNLTDLGAIDRYGRQTIEPVAPTSVQAEKNDCRSQYS
jgi:hypothetical protein